MILESDYIELNDLWFKLGEALEIDWDDGYVNTWRHDAHQRVFNKVLADMGYTNQQWNDYVDIMWEEYSA